ncbi:MAG TPA: iron-sulfur cluster assembly protein [Intrasporangium sp.]|uniref:metal-sulfur cluster assembly factor n=1 Tax=Intrasporangium sp. TaxID=1925024 RepID=UPI002D79BB65|nr:iron-sulfur cluster assembly protein [Intrasporangium sp.]HET7398497.1 iron-sulfur cluster assembly protein [Intrasporangium sp.]
MRERTEMTLVAPVLVTVEAVDAALHTVVDPELDEPITDLGFVRSRVVDGRDVEVHLRLPTSFCAPNFAYLMAADAQDALLQLPGVGRVVVCLDDHHDSDKINEGLAAQAGYTGTFGHEAESGLDHLRRTFQRKAHTAALERACSELLRSGAVTVDRLHELTLGDIPAGRSKHALLRRRADIGLGVGPHEKAFVDDEGRPIPQEQVPVRLRFARTVRISIDGNAHFCRGLLTTRYPGSESDQRPRSTD